MSTDELPQWPPLDPEGRIVWPDHDAERVQLARRLFGEAIVGRADYWIDWAYDLITNPEPPKPYPHENYASEEDRAYRKCFSTLNERQKQVIHRLIRRLVDGVAFSILSRLDQFGAGGDRVEISLIGRRSEGEPVEVPITAPDEEMHEQYIQWQEEFGKHSQELLIDLQGPP
jgi:hypothetical protein